ncbi:hypothetical protein KDN24_06585 [Bacillus sp. Bva_UNVM-123]|uniref:hypothetical protein n=1 Tax=Bacillus sp. Bva_UNVM-123 TaxID=2829798 RepID=UPI00391F281E
MDNKQAAWNEMSKKKFELDDKLSELEQAKDNYKDELINDAINDMMKILSEEGTLTESDFKLFLGNLARDLKSLYVR